MKYVAIFEIPDGDKYGCAIVKHCPSDDKVRNDYEFETASAMLERYDDYKKPMVIDIAHYRRLTLHHMEVACSLSKEQVEELKDETTVLNQARDMMTQGSAKKKEQAILAFYYGQLQLLDFLDGEQGNYALLEDLCLEDEL